METTELAEREDVAAFRAELNRVVREVTQEDWIQIMTRLNMTRAQIAEDANLLMLAMGWVKEKHDHGGAMWNTFLKMTDTELATWWGLTDGSAKTEEE